MGCFMNVLWLVLGGIFTAVEYVVVLMNVLWILLGGIWIALSHLVFGAILCITVIGIPFGLQHFKLAALALTPFGKDIVEKG